MMRFHVALLCLSLCTAGLCADAPATAPLSPAQACREAVTRMMRAMDAADADALRQVIHVRGSSQSQKLGQEVVIDCILAQRSLERAVERRWGTEMLKTVGGPSRFNEADYDAVKKASFEWLDRDRGRAILILSPGVAPLELRLPQRAPPQDPSKWRIVLRAVNALQDNLNDVPEPASAQRIQYLHGVAAALQRVERDVRTGKLGSPEAARDALQALLEETNRSSFESPYERPFAR